MTKFIKNSLVFRNFTSYVLNMGPPVEVDFNQRKNAWNMQTCVTPESNLLFWRLGVANFREKIGLISYAVAGSVKRMPSRNTSQLTKLHNYGHKIPRWFTQADKSNNKAHTLMIILTMYSNIFLAFNLFPDLFCSCPLQICTIDPTAVAH